MLYEHKQKEKLVKNNKNLRYRRVNNTQESLEVLGFLEDLKREFYDCIGRDMYDQEEYNDFVKSYPSVSHFGLVIETKIEILKDKLNLRGVNTD